MKLSKGILSLLCIIAAPSLAIGNGETEVVISIANLKVPGDSPLEYCTEDRSADILEIKYFNVDPNPPRAGENGTVHAGGVLSKDIEEGAYINLEIKYGPITIAKTTVDLCEQVKSANKECPLEEGPIKVKKEFSMPEEIPNGKWKVVADIYTKDDEKITCVIAEVTYPVPPTSEL